MAEFPHDLLSVYQKAVDVVSMCIFTKVITAVLLNGGCGFPDFVTSLKAVDMVFRKLSMDFHIKVK